jgi:hypothetical protein
LERLGKRIAKRQFRNLIEREKQRIDERDERIELNLFNCGLKIDLTEVEKKMLELIGNKKKQKRVNRDKKR